MKLKPIPKLNATAGILVVLAVVLLVAGCARTQPGGLRYLTAESSQRIDSTEDSYAGALRVATLAAEKQARDGVLRQALKITTVDGIRLEEIALDRPEVLAILYDLVRTAPITQREVDSDTGEVSITVRMPISPLRKYLAELNKA